ncbi:hypothetical protein H4219_000170 [Mycoemilia scoparia]|uniref:Hypoxanthine phosphoribosyltransferase n=1 Tax=Mycoemilia scoparia TaxID=417184 RepID=A0A9W8ABS8_9FUNG|nr:hypothetical protein H4219_000170 [Mycoemilia scoparia]
MAKDRQEPWIDVTQEKFNYDSDYFVIPEHYEEDVGNVLIPHGLIMDRINKLAQLITSEFNERLTVCCVLKGGHQFFADLVNAIKKRSTQKGKTLPVSFEFIRVKSYHNDQSTGKVQISLSEDELKDFKDKDILIVEDIIDTGRTMKALLEFLKDYQPRTVKVASLLVKKTPKSNGYIPDYVGFAVPDLFVVGYCLDYNDYFRDLDHICIISDKGRAKYALQ